MKPGRFVCLAVSVGLSASSFAARADEPKHEYPAPSSPYSLPFQLRPAVVANAVRADNVIALYKEPTNDKGGVTVTSIVTGTFKVTPELAPFVRLGFIGNSSPLSGAGATAFTNPALGATYALKPSEAIRLAFLLGVALPLGQGGGNDPDIPKNLAQSTGATSRSAFDNALFAVNDLTIFPGVDVAWVSNNFTVQGEVTFFQLTRVRAEDRQPDSSKTNLTMGLHVAYFIVPQLSAGAEIRHQRFLSTPAAVDKRAALRDTSTFAIGVRGHFKMGETSWFRPAISFSMPIDAPMTEASYKIIQLDLPFIF